MIEVGTLEEDQQCTEWCVVKHTLDSLACCAWLPTSPREVGTTSPRTVWRNEVPSMVHEIKHTPIPTSLGTQNADVKSMSGRGFGARCFDVRNCERTVGVNPMLYCLRVE